MRSLLLLTILLPVMSRSNNKGTYEAIQTKLAKNLKEKD